MLTEKKKRFADNYLISCNATDSAIKAGYKYQNKASLHNKASALLKDKDVRKYINEQLKKKKKELIATQDEVLYYLSRCIRGQETTKYFTVLKTTKKIGNKSISENELIEKDVVIAPKDRIKACEIMAKIYKMMDQPLENRPNIIIKNSIPRK